MTPIQRTAAAFVSILCIAVAVRAAPRSEIVGDVRIQSLSPSLVRIELKGPEGFEERETFHVVNRDWLGAGLARSIDGDNVILRSDRYLVRVPKDAKTLEGVKVESTDGQGLWSFDGKLTNNVWLPSPSQAPKVWAIADAPRLVRGKQGAIPAPTDADHPQTSGWDPANDAPDVYVFLPAGDSKQVRQEFLKLTGPTEMPPLFALGAWDSRWYAYTEQTALQQIDDYRKREIPLDVLVIDTDWRKGGSHGYDVNTDDFPDLPRFFKEAHEKHVRIMFNDHPEPVAGSALDPKEMRYRFDHLSTLLNQGLDIWWFDRNWSTHLLSPMEGLRLEAWGMQVYHDSTLAVRPDQRPMIMANVDGIDNGKRDRAPDMAVHRFPIQWTGDIGPSFQFLRRGVENAVHAGVASAFAYESEDLGGHTSDPSPEGYIRWIEYGAFSPIYRPHCTRNLKRMPWTFGDEAEQIARDYVQMRYRLLPVFYASAHENYQTGEPILRRLDLDYPEHPEAAHDDQYLLGHGILVAPVLTSMNVVNSIPGSVLHTADGQPGLAAEYFDNRDLKGEPVLKRIDADVNFDWEKGSPAPQVPNDNWSARWTGKLGPIPDDGHADRILSTISDDGIRVWIDGEKVIDAWRGQDSATNEAKIALKPGKTYDLKIEYMDMEYTAVCKLNWRRAKDETLAKRQFWIPPGDWIDAWTGETLAGPKTTEMQVPLSRIPLLVKSGTIMPLAPAMQYTGEKPWDPITLDVYPAASAESTLYEDDGISNAYQTGASRTTKVSASADDALKSVRVGIDSAVGTFQGAAANRAWKVRLHVRAASHLSSVQLDGKAVQAAEIAQDPKAMPFATDGGAADSRIIEFDLPSQPVSQRREAVIRF